MTEQQTAVNALLGRLVKVEGNTPDSLGICTMWHRNPDGPEAAERIKSLQAELDKMQEAVIAQMQLSLALGADRQRMRDALVRANNFLAELSTADLDEDAADAVTVGMVFQQEAGAMCSIIAKTLGAKTALANRGEATDA